MAVPLRNKELSWLAFNARVLQEAADPTVPLIERIKFLGIFSSNLDEFFRVRVATLKRLRKLGKKAYKHTYKDPAAVLTEIHERVMALQADFETIYQEILRELAEERIFIINEHQLNDEQAAFVREYFRAEVRPSLIPIMLDFLDQFPELKDHAIYLGVLLSRSGQPGKERHALIEIPTGLLPRFINLPRVEARRYLILLDDVIRFSLADIFAMFDYDTFRAYTIKLTRDAELELDEDLSDSFLKKMSKGLQQRKVGKPVRFLHDHRMPDALLDFLVKGFLPEEGDRAVIPGSRYHNFKDFIGFPTIGSPSLRNLPQRVLPHPDLDRRRGLLKTVEEKDILLHFPYQSFDYVIDFLREAAIDPKVVGIRITLYRVARKSKIINALINAAQNGKAVTVVMEFQARFDEEANIYWANRLQEEGVRVVHADPNYKVHAKMILVRRVSGGKEQLLVNLGTGNFNESTARLYTDHSLFTANPAITREVKQVFELIENKYLTPNFRNLLVSPMNMRTRLTKMINQEIANAKAGKPAAITVKLNNLTDSKMIKKLYHADQAGVRVRLMVRGMFSLVAGRTDVSEGIEARGIVDKYLEHSRIYVFHNGGEDRVYLTSADWMQALKDINDQFGTTTAVITHNASIRKMAHRVIRFQDGKIGEVAVNETRIDPKDIEW